MCISKGVLGDMLPWPIKKGFAFDSAFKETDDPAKLKYFGHQLMSGLFLSLFQKHIILCWT